MNLPQFPPRRVPPGEHENRAINRFLQRRRSIIEPGSMRRLPPEIRDNIVRNLGTDNIEQGMIITRPQNFEVQNLQNQRVQELFKKRRIVDKFKILNHFPGLLIK